MSHALLLVPLRFPPRPRRRQAPVLQSKRDPGRPHQPPVLFKIPHPRGRARCLERDDGLLGGCGARAGQLFLERAESRLHSVGFRQANPIGLPVPALRRMASLRFASRGNPISRWICTNLKVSGTPAERQRERPPATSRWTREYSAARHLHV